MIMLTVLLLNLEKRSGLFFRQKQYSIMRTCKELRLTVMFLQKIIKNVKKIVNKYTFTISNDFVILRRHSDLFKLSTNDNLKIFVGQVEELENEKRQQIAKLKAQEKRVDHLERAKRKEEIPLLLEAIKQVSLETDVEYFDFEGIFSAI